VKLWATNEVKNIINDAREGKGNKERGVGTSEWLPARKVVISLGRQKAGIRQNYSVRSAVRRGRTERTEGEVWEWSECMGGQR